MGRAATTRVHDEPDQRSHPPKVLVTKIGLDGHDRGSRVVAAFLRDAGMEVLYTPPWQEIGQVVRLAEEEDVDVIGISSLATDHLLVPKLHEGAEEGGARARARGGRRHRARRGREEAARRPACATSSIPARRARRSWPGVARLAAEARAAKDKEVLA